jgi:hypothetical protein
MLIIVGLTQPDGCAIFVNFNNVTVYYDEVDLTNTHKKTIIRNTDGNYIVVKETADDINKLVWKLLR